MIHIRTAGSSPSVAVLTGFVVVGVVIVIIGGCGVVLGAGGEWFTSSWESFGSRTLPVVAAPLCGGEGGEEQEKKGRYRRHSVG